MDNTSTAGLPSASLANQTTSPSSANLTTAGQLESASSPERQEMFPMIAGVLVPVITIVFSAPPAAVIWRTPSLHRTSYYYVMVLSLLDCFFSAVSLTTTLTVMLLGALAGGIARWVCVIFEAILNASMNAINVVMLALGRDRYLSVEHPLSYPLRVTTADVRRHVKMAAVYGAVHGSIFVGARVYYSEMLTVQNNCLALNWLLTPEYRAVAIVTVFSNIFLDIGTVVYNGRVMYLAWKLKTNQIYPQSNEQERAQLRRHMKIFIFTFKLACLFLVCSLPYKLAILLHAVGVHSSETLIRVLGGIRMLYYIMNGWTFCTNEELLDAMRVMFRGWREHISNHLNL